MDERTQRRAQRAVGWAALRRLIPGVLTARRRAVLAIVGALAGGGAVFGLSFGLDSLALWRVVLGAPFVFIGCAGLACGITALIWYFRDRRRAPKVSVLDEGLLGRMIDQNSGEISIPPERRETVERLVGINRTVHPGFALSQGFLSAGALFFAPLGLILEVPFWTTAPALIYSLSAITVLPMLATNLGLAELVAAELDRQRGDDAAN